jgi:hypothetical protein
MGSSDQCTLYLARRRLHRSSKIYNQESSPSLCRFFLRLQDQPLRQRGGEGGEPEQVSWFDQEIQAANEKLGSFPKAKARSLLQDPYPSGFDLFLRQKRTAIRDPLSEKEQAIFGLYLLSAETIMLHV